MSFDERLEELIDELRISFEDWTEKASEDVLDRSGGDSFGRKLEEMLEGRIEDSFDAFVSAKLFGRK